MLVVPLVKDIIETKDGARLQVSGFTNFKPKGPAIYGKGIGDDNSKPLVAIYFFDIDKINDVRVEYSNSSKIFSAYGKIKRKEHLPQIHDTIFVKDDKVKNQDKKVSNLESKKVKVTGYKLHSKKYGIAKGLIILCDDENAYTLHDILNIEREIGSSNEFNQKAFLKLYVEYAGNRY